MDYGEPPQCEKECLLLSRFEVVPRNGLREPSSLQKMDVDVG